MPRYVCIHGHFYQPPRENPWLELVEVQESAAPWHDWNERITAECYRRNAASRILDDNGNIKKICNNYSRMSFNIGPTLMSWLKDNASRSYQSILDADASGKARFSGHGPAIAQVYSHMIMPLANRRDKTTQVKWGIEDFKSRFGRMPEGMWLAETAVDTESLEVLAENGILFTILAPSQASEVRFLSDTGESWAWYDVKWGRVDSSVAYRCDLPSGRSISIFFYDGGLSQAIAFGGLLNSGDFYADRLIKAKPAMHYSTLSHVATDGESYGHHHKNGDMALSYCLDTIDSGSEAKLTVYGEFLSKNPPLHAVRIVENSAWSCAHGVERWRSDCGCSSGTPGYHQKWRKPLRDALDWLRDKLAVQFEREGANYLKNPWTARDAYISAILDRSKDSVDTWLVAHSSRPLTPEENTRVLKLMECQRAAMLMYTSCGWFFDEISGLETTQILRYASHAINLTRELTGLNFEPEFERLLEKAPSNVPEFINGRRVYELLVKPARISFERLAAHYAMNALIPGISSMFSTKADDADGCFDITGKITASVASAAKPEANPGERPVSLAFVAGELTVSSNITREEKRFIFAANYRGDAAILCGIAPVTDETLKILEDAETLRNIFACSDDEKMVAIFGHNIFSLRHLLSFARKEIVDHLLQNDTARIEQGLRDIVHDYYGLFDALAVLGSKAPNIISSSASIVLTADVLHGLEEDAPNVVLLRKHLSRSTEWGITLDSEKIGIFLYRWLMKEMRKILDNPDNAATMERVCSVLALFLDEFKWHISLYEAQNIYYAILNKLHIEQFKMSSELVSSFRRLGQSLRFAEDVLIGAWHSP